MRWCVPNRPCTPKDTQEASQYQGAHTKLTCHQYWHDTRHPMLPEATPPTNSRKEPSHRSHAPGATPHAPHIFPTPRTVRVMVFFSRIRLATSSCVDSSRVSPFTLISSSPACRRTSLGEGEHHWGGREHHWGKGNIIGGRGTSLGEGEHHWEEGNITGGRGTSLGGGGEHHWGGGEHHWEEGNIIRGGEHHWGEGNIIGGGGHSGGTSFGGRGGCHSHFFLPLRLANLQSILCCL